jgi:hypothetical protein
MTPRARTEVVAAPRSTNTPTFSERYQRRLAELRHGEIVASDG